MNPTLRVSRSSRFTAVALEGGYVLYDGVNLRLLAGPAALVWDHIDDVSTGTALARRIAVLYPDALHVHDDVLEFIETLARWGIVDVLAPPPEFGYVRPAHTGFAHDGDCLLLVNMDSGQRRALTPTGTVVWELVCEQRYASLVVAALQRQFPEAPASVQAEVHALLDDLVESGFLTRREGLV